MHSFLIRFVMEEDQLAMAHNMKGRVHINPCFHKILRFILGLTTNKYFLVT